MYKENERIKELRKSLKLSQEEFGDAIGLTKSSISNVEKGVRNVTEQHIKLITIAYNVNEHWLRTGEGEMFAESDDTLLSELAKEYQLDTLDKKLIEHYLKLDEGDRKVIKDYMLSIAAGLADHNETAATTTELTPEQIADEEAEKYRLEVLAELKGETLSVSAKHDEKLG